MLFPIAFQFFHIQCWRRRSACALVSGIGTKDSFVHGCVIAALLLAWLGWFGPRLEADETSHGKMFRKFEAIGVRIALFFL